VWPRPLVSSLTLAPTVAAQVAPLARRSWNCRPEVAAFLSRRPSMPEYRPAQGVTFGASEQQGVGRCRDVLVKVSLNQRRGRRTVAVIK
jgi:hypothetical protein